MENSLNERLNASQILHLAIQKVDGIIASNDNIDASSTSHQQHHHQQSQHHQQQENSYFESTSTFHFATNTTITPQTTNIFQNRSSKDSLTSLDSLSKSFSPIQENNVNSSFNSNIVNGNRKIARNQDKLNKLLQELQDFSLEEKQQQQQQQTNSASNNLQISMDDSSYCDTTFLMSEFELNPNTVCRSATDVNSAGNTDDGGSSASSSAPTIDADSLPLNGDASDSTVRHSSHILPDSMDNSFYRARNSQQYRQSVDPALLEDALRNLARNPNFSNVVGSATPPFSSYSHLPYHSSNQDLGALAGLYPAQPCYPPSSLTGSYTPGMGYGTQQGSTAALAAAVAAAAAAAAGQRSSNYANFYGFPGQMSMLDLSSHHPSNTFWDSSINPQTLYQANLLGQLAALRKTQLAAQTTPSGSATPGNGQHHHSSMPGQTATGALQSSSSVDVSNTGSGAGSTKGHSTTTTSSHANTTSSATGAPTDHHFQPASPVNDNASSQNHQQQQQQHPLQQLSNAAHLENNLELSERLIHLESMNNILRSQLMNTEELFKKSLLSKKALENANCDLLTVIDKLKLDVSHADNLRKLAEEHNSRSETENQTLKTRLLERETEISSLRLTLAKIVRTTGYTLSDNELALLSGKTIASDYIKNKLLSPSSAPQHHPTTPLRKDNTPHGTPIKPMTLPRSMPSGAFYSEPASRRDSFSSTLCGSRYNSVQPSPSGTPPPPIRYSSNQQSHSSQITPTTTAGQMIRSTSEENMKSNGVVPSGDHSACDNQNTAGDYSLASPSTVRNTSIYSTLPHSVRKARRTRANIEQARGASVDTERRQQHGNNDFQPESGTLYRNQNSRSLFDDLNLVPFSSTPSSPIMKSSVHYIGDWPLKDETHDDGDAEQFHYGHDGHDDGDYFDRADSRCHRSGKFFDRAFFWLKKNKRAASAPELAKDDDVVMQSASVSTAESQLPAFRLVSYPDRSPKGFKKFFSKSKRSTSSVSGLSDPFQRGGVRATSGPRLGSYVNAEKRFQKINTPFAQWDTALIADWFALIGLGMYVPQCKRWIVKGEQLMSASSTEVERELGMKNPLHRKKLRLAVASMSGDESDMSKNASKLDYLWIAKWLDDIGLPQYKDTFIDARIDGRMLHYMTIEDLLTLKINSLMHLASIRAGIRVLRENDFNSACLKRRSTEEGSSSSKWTLDEVSLWSSHRVMEWLRSIDLSEYAPNLRGSGVHGGLILYENAFNSGLFATLLSIPESKTLLRKHITTKFHELIGEELHKIKNEHEQAPNYVPMTLSAKIKAHKKFSLMRKKKTDFEITEYVCPMSGDFVEHRSRGNSLTKSSVSSDGTNTSKSDFSRTFTPDQEALSKSEIDILEKAE